MLSNILNILVLNCIEKYEYILGFVVKLPNWEKAVTIFAYERNRGYVLYT